MRQGVKGFIIGVAAGAAALLFSFFLRMFTNAPFVPELAAQTLFSLAPGEIESRAVESLGPLAKYSAFAGAIIINLALYGILGALLFKWTRGILRFGKALQFSIAAYLVIFAVSVLLLRATEILTQPTSIEILAAYLLPPQVIFGSLLSYGYQRTLQPSPIIGVEEPSSGRRFDNKRRLIIRTAAAGVVASIILFYGLDLIFPRSTTPPNQENLDVMSSLLASEVTLNDQFYRIDVNIVSPRVDASSWKLAVKGLVNNPLALTLEELKSLPIVEQHSTLECISNEIGGDLISNALWKGVPLKRILEKAQVKPEATYIIFRCQDGYDVGIPLERGLQDGSLLAYEMNGATLPTDHGYPLRAIIPGLYGMMNAKWITEIELVNKIYEGFWQRRGWANNAEYQTHSMILAPGNSGPKARFRNLASPNTVLGRKAPIAGIAFAGDRGISKVEVSTDGGKTWQTASIKDPLSQYTWVFWSAEWNPPAQGQYKLIVRAYDKTGRIQKAELQSPFPEGATGYHTVDVRVEAPS